MLLSGFQNSEPPSGNDELCAKLQTLMLENVVEDTQEEYPHVTNQTKLYILCFHALPFLASASGVDEIK